MLVYIRLDKDIQAYNEGAPIRGPLKVPMMPGSQADPSLPATF